MSQRKGRVRNFEWREPSQPDWHHELWGALIRETVQEQSKIIECKPPKYNLNRKILIL